MGSTFELRDVAAAREIDADLAGHPAVRVVLVEAAAQPSSLDADDRIHAGIVGGVPVEHLDADRVFLQLIRVTGEGFLRDVAQQAAQAAGILEALARQHAVQFGENSLGGDVHAPV